MDDMAAIHFASQKGHLEVVKALVSAGASVKALTRKGMNVLHYAAQGSHLELVKYLAKKGASLTAKTKAGKTPFELATNEEVCSFLEGFEKSAKNGESSNKDEAKESDPMTSSLGSEDNLSAEPPAASIDEESGERQQRKGNEAAIDEENGEREKRKGDEDDAGEDSSKPKKARVKLSHLQSSDDIQEEENE